MTLGGVAALIAALGFVGLVLFLGVTLLRLQGILKSSRDLVDEINRTAIPVIVELQQTVTSVNHQLDRVDHILAAAENVSAGVAKVTTLVTSATTNPLVKGLSFMAGARAGVKSLWKRKQK